MNFKKIFSWGGAPLDVPLILMQVKKNDGDMHLIRHLSTYRAVQSSYGQAENRMFDITIECTVAGTFLIPSSDLFTSFAVNIKLQ